MAAAAASYSKPPLVLLNDLFACLYCLLWIAAAYHCCCHCRLLDCHCRWLLLLIAVVFAVDAELWVKLAGVTCGTIPLILIVFLDVSWGSLCRRVWDCICLNTEPPLLQNIACLSNHMFFDNSWLQNAYVFRVKMQFNWQLVVKSCVSTTIDTGTHIPHTRERVVNSPCGSPVFTSTHIPLVCATSVAF